MRTIFRITVALLGAMTISTAHAQTICPDGKTFSGACVKADLGESVRKQVLVFTQPKISYTAPPVLPSEDGAYSIPRDYNELVKIYSVGKGGNGVTCVPSIIITCP